MILSWYKRWTYQHDVTYLLVKLRYEIKDIFHQVILIC